MRTLTWLCFVACAGSPSDDPSDYHVDTTRSYQPVLGEPRFVVPGDLPVFADTSNNNVSILAYGGRLFMAFRTGPTHFASPDTRMHILSSTDGGRTWAKEQSFFVGYDMREPHLYTIKGKLFFNFFEAGLNAIAFEPRAVWRTQRQTQGRWMDKVSGGDAGEVPWNVKTRNGRVWMTSYSGNHYVIGPSLIDVHFKVSDDGETFTALGPPVYTGGVSEVAFEFTAEGDLWAVTRNEDGDATGFGSHICFASHADLSKWDCSPHSSPLRYDSPQMFRHGAEIYLVARRDPDGPYDEGRMDLSFEEQKVQYLLGYSNRRKRTALYHLDTSTRTIEHLFDFPSAGDTAFPSIQRMSEHHFLIANYTSPLETDPTWIEGQTSAKGTQIYLVDLTFR